MNMKKFGALALAGCLLCVGVQAVPTQDISIIAAAETYATGSDGLKYVVYDDYALVVGAAEEKVNIFIPDTVQTDDGRTLPVTGVGGLAAFANQKTIESLHLGANVKTLGQEAFENCTALTTIEFNDGLEIIGTWAFRGCTALETLTLPPNLTMIKGQSFRECTNLKSVHFSGGNDLVLEDSLIFYECDALETVTMDAGVVEIGNTAFSDLTNLKHVQLSPTLKTIGSYAFAGTGISEIDIPESVETIDIYAFKFCSNLKQVTLHEGLKTINDHAFVGCGMEEMIIPASVETIQDYAFSSSLRTITFFGADTPIPDGFSNTTVIRGFADSTAQTFATANKYLFDAIDSVPEEIGVYDGLKFHVYDDHAVVYGATEEKFWVYLPEEFTKEDGTSVPVTGVEAGAFRNMITIENVTLSSNIEYVDAYEFEGCTGIKNIDFSDNIKSIGTYAFSGCSSVESLVLPENLEIIEPYTFYRCNLLADVKFGSKLTTIKEYAFANCGSLTALTFPASLELIEDNAFNFSNSLRTFIFYGMDTEIYGIDYGTIYGYEGFTVQTYTDNKLHVQFIPLEGTPETSIAGDVNADGVFNLSDIVMMQKYLLKAGNLTDWKAGDLHEDKQINIYDLILMKRLLLSK